MLKMGPVFTKTNIVIRIRIKLVLVLGSLVLILYKGVQKLIRKKDNQ